MSEREAVFWTCDDAVEILTAEDIGEAVEQWADNCEGPMPETVQVYGFAPMPLPAVGPCAERVLEDLVEWLDEEYGNPDGPYTEPSAAMKAAALAFVQAVFSEYKAWTCERVTTQTVRVRDYVPERTP